MAEETPPPCPKDGITMRPTTRVMRSHGLQAGKAIPEDKTVNVWRCPACGRELPRSA
jgi:predicted RNA-binding Zn-ribbon protein involved in translation (DUF1610 family)